MGLPNQQEILLPLLNAVRDGAEHHVNEVVDFLVEDFNFSKEEKILQYPSGNDNIFRNRVRFARAFLVRAGLLEHPKRGYIKISKVGLKTLERGPSKIDTKFLNQLSGMTFPSRRRGGEVTKEIDVQNPSDLMEHGYQSIRRDLAHDILEIIKKCSPYFLRNLLWSC